MCGQGDYGVSASGSLPTSQLHGHYDVRWFGTSDTTPVIGASLLRSGAQTSFSGVMSLESTGGQDAAALSAGSVAGIGAWTSHFEFIAPRTP